MELEIDVLAALAEVDDQIRLATRRRDEARASVPAAKASLAAAAAKVEALDAALAAHATEERATERKREEYRTHLSRALRAQETGAGDADAAERQRVSCLAIIDELETTLLEQMEARDALESERAERKAAVGAATEVLVDAERKSEPEVQAQRQILDELDAERSRLRALVHPEELRRYDQLLTRSRRPVSPLIGDTCKACNRVQVARTLQELKRGRLVQCAGCGRWLHAPHLVITDSAPEL